MFIPFKSDAPMYYRPIGTFSLMAANVLIFAAMGPVQVERLWILQFGTINPIQWFTSAFNHAGVGHLGGNMLFLFIFGLVVEGRMGWRKFLPLYLALAGAGGCVVQLLMIGAGPVSAGYGALGASGAIYGLMVIAVFWAPKSEVSVLFWFYSASRVFEVRLRTIVFIYVGMDLAVAHLLGFAMSTPVLHLVGGAMGILPAIWLPRTGKIYLGDWDGWLALPFNVVFTSEEKREVEEVEAPPEPVVSAPRETDREAIARLLDAGETDDAVRRILDLLDREPTGHDDLRIEAADLLVRVQERPQKALEVLGGIENGALLSPERTRIDRIAARALEQIQDGVIELG